MSVASEERFRLSRGGVLNVWQYDEQVFDFAEGRLLLRGANGAGKSKTLELLMPFVIDGDKARMTASGKHTTSLLWLMLDGHDSGGRTGYVWVEFARRTADGHEVTMTCGVGLRASESARTATSWFFTSPRRVGVDLLLEDETGPLSQPQLKAEVESDGEGRFFDSPRRYKEHVGQALFGLPVEQYDELLRLIYWLRQPQVGEDIDPKRLAEQLVNALPQVDDSAVRSAGDTFDELEAFGEEIERRDRAARAIMEVVATYAVYARSVVAERAAAVVDAATRLRRSESALRRSERELAEARVQLGFVDAGRAEQVGLVDETQRRITALEQGPEARTRGRLKALAETVRARGEQSRIAERTASEARVRVDRSSSQAAELGETLARGVGQLHGDARRVASELSGLGVASDVAALVVASVPGLDWRLEDSGTDVVAALDVVAGWSRKVKGPAGQRRAAIVVVDQARVAAEHAKERADRVEGEVAAAEGRVDQATERAAVAARASRDLEADLLERLESWQRDGDAVPFERPDLTVDGLGALDPTARTAAAGRLDALTEALAAAGAAVHSAESRVAELRIERERVASRCDPEPTRPAWERTPREGRAGAPFWRLVDFRDDLDLEARARVEAALESSGILDAWVQPDGRIDGRGDLDVWLRPDGEALSAGAAAAAGSGTLASVLRVDASGVTDDEGAPALVSSTVVAAVLSSIAVRDTIAVDPVAAAPDGSIAADAPDATLAADAVDATVAAGSPDGSIAADGPDAATAVDAPDGSIAGDALDATIAAGAPAAVVGLDGSWRLGLVSGRASKRVAQYIGASARAEERRRRLDDLDSQLADVAATLALATAERDRVRDQLGRTRGWLERRPHHDQVLRAWATEDEREQAVGLRRAELDEVSVRARAARAEAATRHTELEGLAQLHALPTTETELRARGESLATAVSALGGLESRASRLSEDLGRWGRDAATARADVASLSQASDEAQTAAQELQSVQAERDELLQAEGASVADLETRLSHLAETRIAAQGRAAQLDTEHDVLTGRVGGAGSRVETEAEQVETNRPLLHDNRARLAALVGVPGVVTSAGIVEGTADAAVLTGQDIAPLTAMAQRLGVSADEASRAHNAVLAGMAALLSGDAAVNEPRFSDEDGVLVAIGRDDSGDLPLVDLAARLTVSVARDRELLSERERRLFEEHVLGQLGDALRSVRVKADELVAAMNAQLHDVTTSQGIRVRLRWRLRDDIPREAGRAVSLLAQPMGALLADERTELREVLHRLIEVSRAEAPEESYAEHLAKALDYRQWHAFTVQYFRPEAGSWSDLQRKTALSQGEQKVLCYLPLFAAAAAHFESLAGAAPWAPRFVLLDDAFPKIDVRTHPLLFGLLVDLDLDFIITSERLWGTHSTVPQLAIYEALRSPHERGIAQYQHRWDGQQLTTVGA